MTTIHDLYVKGKKIVSMGLMLYLRKRGLISNPLTPDDLVRIKFLEDIFRDSVVLRSQLRRRSNKDRMSLILTADYSQLHERWISTYFWNHFQRDDYRKNLTVAKVEETVKSYFPKLKGKDLKSIVRKIRGQVWNRIKYLRRKEEEVIRELEAPIVREFNGNGDDTNGEDL